MAGFGPRLNPRTPAAVCRAMTTSMHARRWWALALVATLGTLALLAARQSDAAGAAAGAAGPGASASAAKTVQIRNFAFHPPTLKVNRGTRVTFVNSSGVTHTATRGGSFDTKQIAPGRSATVRFNRKGTFAYHCTIHPTMRGKVVVE